MFAVVLDRGGEHVVILALMVLLLDAALLNQWQCIWLKAVVIGAAILAAVRLIVAKHNFM